MDPINFFPFPKIETERFTLRQLKIEDENEIFALRSDEGVARYLDRPRAKSINDAREFIHKINSSISENELVYWAITQRGEDKVIGTICLWKISQQQAKAEIGFELLPAYQGRSIMQEVIPRVIEFGFKILNLKIIEGEVAPDNIKSIKLMERFGFKLKTTLNKTLLYVLIKNEE